MLRIAVGIIGDKQGRLLVAQRPSGKFLGGKWEFPGGKLEEKESSRDAITRELQEELGIDATAMDYLTQIFHDYDDFSVCLDVWMIRAFDGEPQGNEGQILAWHTLEQVSQLAIPPANIKIVQALGLALRP